MIHQDILDGILTLVLSGSGKSSMSLWKVLMICACAAGNTFSQNLRH